jgi:hypothetical protein
MAKTGKRKGQTSKFSVSGEGDLYEELKERVNIAITPTAKNGLDKMADELGISRSELIERVGRGELKGIDDLSPKKSPIQWVLLKTG